LRHGLVLASSEFDGVFLGDRLSGCMEDSMLHGCIPLIVQAGIHLPFENVLDYKPFTLQVAEKDLPHLVRILQGIDETRVDAMLSSMQKMWQRFTYHSVIKLEAQRQKMANKGEAALATQYNKLVEDDAFATLIYSGVRLYVYEQDLCGWPQHKEQQK
jgi:hypothetical protein